MMIKTGSEHAVIVDKGVKMAKQIRTTNASGRIAHRKLRFILSSAGTSVWAAMANSGTRPKKMPGISSNGVGLALPIEYVPKATPKIAQNRKA